MTEQLFFNDWKTLYRTAMVGVLAYLSLITLLRISGKRTLSKMNAFDLVVTVSLGSTLATILLNKEVALAEGALALGLLIGLQFVITWTSTRLPWLRKLVTGEPLMVFYRGRFLERGLVRARLTEDEVRSAIRRSGAVDVNNVEAVVLETDGSFSVVMVGEPGVSSLIGVHLPTGETVAE